MNDDERERLRERALRVATDIISNGSPDDVERFIERLEAFMREKGIPVPPPPSQGNGNY